MNDSVTPVKLATCHSDRANLFMGLCRECFIDLCYVRRGQDKKRRQIKKPIHMRRWKKLPEKNNGKH